MSSHLFSQDVVPIGIGYLILMGVLAAGLGLQRRSAVRSASAPSTASKPSTATSGADDSGGKVPGPLARRFPPGWPRFLAQIASTALAGYVLIMAVDLLYYYGVARLAGQFLESAFTGSALLLAISLPLFAGRSWLAERRRRDQGQAQGESSPEQ